MWNRLTSWVNIGRLAGLGWLASGWSAEARQLGLPSVVLLWLSGGLLAFTFFLSLWIWNSEASRSWTPELSDSYRALRFETTHVWASEFETLTLCVPGTWCLQNIAESLNFNFWRFASLGTWTLQYTFESWGSKFWRFVSLGIWSIRRISEPRTLEFRRFVSLSIWTLQNIYESRGLLFWRFVFLGIWFLQNISEPLNFWNEESICARTHSEW